MVLDFPSKNIKHDAENIKNLSWLEVKHDAGLSQVGRSRLQRTSRKEVGKDDNTAEVLSLFLSTRRLRSATRHSVVMLSGNKARGRKNRAKKETAAQRTLWEQTVLRNNGGASNNASASSCEHMLTALPRIPFMNFLAGKGFFLRDPSEGFFCHVTTEFLLTQQ